MSEWVPVHPNKPLGPHDAPKLYAALTGNADPAYIESIKREKLRIRAERRARHPPRRAVFAARKFQRIRWNLLESAPLTVEVLEWNDGQDQPRWVDLRSHPFWMEPATNTHRSRMLVNLETFRAHDFFHDACIPTPDPLVIENADGSQITVAQFITEMSRHVSGMAELLEEVTDRSGMMYYCSCHGPFYTPSFKDTDTPDPGLDPDRVFWVDTCSPIRNAARVYTGEEIDLMAEHWESVVKRACDIREEEKSEMERQQEASAVGEGYEVTRDEAGSIKKSAE